MDSDNEQKYEITWNYKEPKSLWFLSTYAKFFFELPANIILAIGCTVALLGPIPAIIEGANLLYVLLFSLCSLLLTIISFALIKVFYHIMNGYVEIIKAVTYLAQKKGMDTK